MNSKMDINIDPTDPKTLKEIHNILITQPKPESEKSPYFEMARKFNVDLSFANPISIDPVSSKEFRKQKIDISSFTAVIFNSRTLSIIFSGFAMRCALMFRRMLNISVSLNR